MVDVRTPYRVGAYQRMGTPDVRTAVRANCVYWVWGYALDNADEADRVRQYHRTTTRLSPTARRESMREISRDTFPAPHILEELKRAYQAADVDGRSWNSGQAGQLTRIVPAGCPCWATDGDIPLGAQRLRCL